MITTLFFLQLTAFQLWYITSGQQKQANPDGYLKSILKYKEIVRWVGALLVLVATTLFIVKFGWMTGICASLVGLMGVGGLVVLLNPFRYLNEKAVIILYFFFVSLEILI